MCDDHSQLLYVRCSYTYPSGQPCSKPVPGFLCPPLCGGHCDNVELQEGEEGGVETLMVAAVKNASSDGGDSNVHVDQS